MSNKDNLAIDDFDPLFPADDMDLDDADPLFSASMDAADYEIEEELAPNLRAASSNRMSLFNEIRDRRVHQQNRSEFSNNYEEGNNYEMANILSSYGL